MKLESILKYKMHEEVKRIIFEEVIEAFKKFVFWHIVSVIYTIKISKINH
jgi:hypothetical protein